MSRKNKMIFDRTLYTLEWCITSSCEHRSAHQRHSQINEWQSCDNSSGNKNGFAAFEARIARSGDSSAE